MRKLSVILGMAVLAMMVVGTGLAQAATATWTFSSPNGTVATPHTYLDTTSGSSVPITAYGDTTVNGPTTVVVGTSTWGPGGSFTNDTGTITAHALFGKNGGTGETGLGLDGLLSDNEIEYKSFVQLDVTTVKSDGYTNLAMSIGSIQAGEGYYLWGSNTLGTPGKLLKTTLGLPEVQTFDIPDFATYNFFSISATPIQSGYSSSDILIVDGLTTAFTPVPIPGAVWLLGSGLVGLAGLRRKLKS